VEEDSGYLVSLFSPPRRRSAMNEARLLSGAPVDAMRRSRTKYERERKKEGRSWIERTEVGRVKWR
jgi:hypothetical protein